MKKRTPSHIKSAVVAILFFGGVIALRANTITVTNTSDNGPGSLRQALADANDGDVIDATGVSGVITLTSGELLVDKSITISGPGVGNLAVNGNAKSRVLHIAPGTTATISDLSITNGNASGNVLDGGGIYSDHAILTLNDCGISNNSAFRDGGGVYNGGRMPPGRAFGSATLTLNNCVVSDNSTGNDGGGICNDASFGGNASLQISNSAVRGNSALYGAGMLNDARGKGIAMLHISDSTLSKNAAGYGGAILSIGDNLKSTPLTVSNCTISGNSAQVWGGGIFNHGMLTIGNSTISGNHVDGGGGGGVYNESSILSVRTTFSDNSASSGGGIYNTGGGFPPSALEISNTILNAGASGETFTTAAR